MGITRRQFNAGAVALAATSALPRFALPAQAGYDDAYARILGELIRVEEAARRVARSGRQMSTVTWKGRHLENFLAALDARVDPVQTAGQIFGEFRRYLKSNARLLQEQKNDRARDLARDIQSYAEEWLCEPQTETEPGVQSGEISANPAEDRS